MPEHNATHFKGNAFLWIQWINRGIKNIPAKGLLVSFEYLLFNG